MTTPTGLLVLDKPTGLTSRDVVDRVSRPLRKVKVGHAGTLDPLASGVLVVCVGPATRLIEYVQRMPKSYAATIRLGATSDTCDADGTIRETEGATPPAEADVRAALAGQVGTIDQLPPDFSALKVQGRRAYDLARAGEPVTLAARPVTIRRCDLIGYDWPLASIEVDCGSGTYIRSIARDLGQALGCGGLITVLTRTRIGPFDLESATDPMTLDRDSILAALRPAAEAVAGMPLRSIDAIAIEEIRRGRSIAADPPAEPGEVALLGPDGSLVAISEAVEGGSRLAPRRVLISG